MIGEGAMSVLDNLQVQNACPSRADIDWLEGLMLGAETQGNGTVLETWHEFANGLMGRAILIPKGVALSGAEHLEEHLNVCFGDITVWAPDVAPKRLTGFHMIRGLAGVKRQGLAHADTWWATVHLNPRNERDIAKLEDALVVDSHMLQRRRLALVSHESSEALAP